MSQIENYKNCGFANDNDLKVLQSTILRLSEIHMDIYIENPYMLLSRLAEKKVSGSIEDDRIIFYKNDRKHTFLFNVLQNEITECMFKKYSEAQYEFVFRIHSITYKLLVII